MIAWKRSALVLLTAATAATAGCSSSSSPKEALLDAITKTNEAKTFTYKGTITINDIRLPQAPSVISGKDAMLRTALPILLKGAVIQVHGAVRKDPQRAEMTLDATLGTGDVKLTVKIPVIVAEEKIYMKVPQIPGVAIPASIADRFVVIDAKRLAEEQGGSNAQNGEGAAKAGKAAIAALFDSLDEQTYFSEPAAADVPNLPPGDDADRYVRMKIDGQHSDEALTAIAGKAVPQAIESLLRNEAALKAFGLTKEKLEASKSDLTAEKLKERYTIENAEFTGGIKAGFLTYETGNLQLNSTDILKGMTLDVHFDLSQDDINKEVKFEVELPKDAVPVDKWAP